MDSGTTAQMTAGQKALRGGADAEGETGAKARARARTKAEAKQRARARVRVRVGDQAEQLVPRAIRRRHRK